MNEQTPTREIERKWILKNLPDLDGIPADPILQGFLFAGGRGYLRIRKKGDDKHFMTVKGEGLDDCPEWEDPIPAWVFKNLWPRVENRIIRKTRYSKQVGNELVEVDIFHNDLAPLLCVEVEFRTKEERDAYVLPSYYGEAVEVTHDPRYKNINLALHGLPADRPFKK